MIKRFTYKELTLVIGIVVALLVIFTLWLRQPSGTFSGYIKTLRITLAFQQLKKAPLKIILPLSRSFFKVEVILIDVKNQRKPVS